jgi:hypothetical protein
LKSKSNYPIPIERDWELSQERSDAGLSRLRCREIIQFPLRRNKCSLAILGFMSGTLKKKEKMIEREIIDVNKASGM